MLTVPLHFGTATCLKHSLPAAGLRVQPLKPVVSLTSGESDMSATMLVATGPLHGMQNLTIDGASPWVK